MYIHVSVYIVLTMKVVGRLSAMGHVREVGRRLGIYE